MTEQELLAALDAEVSAALPCDWHRIIAGPAGPCLLPASGVLTWRDTCMLGAPRPPDHTKHDLVCRYHRDALLELGKVGALCTWCGRSLRATQHMIRSIYPISAW